MPTKELVPQLDVIVAARRQNVQERKAKTPIEAVRALASMQKRPIPILNTVTHGGQVVFIGQLSPGQGNTAALIETGKRLARSVDGVALFTDDTLYSNGLSDLVALSREMEKLNIPTISKDVILDEYQVVEARAAGAAALMLRSSVLEPPLMRSLVSATQRHRMTAIVEVRNKNELEYALSLSPYAIALSSRDHWTQEPNTASLSMLRAMIPARTHVMLSESLQTLDDAHRAADLKVDAAFVDAALLLDTEKFRALHVILRPSSPGDAH